jgi:hypothetical protein
VISNAHAIAAAFTARAIIDRFSAGVSPEVIRKIQKPTESQREAGNYAKGHVRIHGLDITIETPRGESRKPGWPKLAAHYGYVKGTKGHDGDHFDVFIGPDTDSEIVVVVDQVNQNGQFDEHKALIGFRSTDEAKKAYLACYSKGWKLGPVTTMTIGQFKAWLERGTQNAPISKQVSRYAAGDQTTGKFGDRGRYVTGDGGQQFFLTNSGEIGRTGKKITGPPSPVKSTPGPAGNRPAAIPKKTMKHPGGGTGIDLEGRLPMQQGDQTAKEKPVQSTGEVKEPTPGSKSHPLHYSNLPEAIRQPLIAWTNDAEAIVQPIAQAMHGASLAHESRQSEGRLRAAKSGQEFEPSPDDTLADSIRKAAARQWGGYVQSGGVDPKLVALGVRQTSQAVQGVDPKQVANHLGKLTAMIQEARQQGVDIRPFILHNNMIPRILAAKLKPNPKLFEPVKPEERFSARFA